ncbi:MAG: aldolase catalytic domain-containing protein [Lachnospiraceae bacterium]|nr:aldolase catalytic domain-containing protein [Lachnospiraceae bacterium]
MGEVRLLDCTLRDGGYINDWQFGQKAISDIGQKIAEAGVELFEVGFIKETEFSKDRAVYPDITSIAPVIAPKNNRMTYVGMLDMSHPLPEEKLIPYDGTSVDALRVIFKKDKIDLGYHYCELVKKLGYRLFVQLVGTDNYTDVEFVNTIQRFNALNPDAVYIVDSFGLIKKKQFLRLVYLADNNLKSGIALGYHSHNNLQQAFGNAEALVECNLQRDLMIDACVFGMGRGAGNLNLELFAEYMNENFGKNYRLEPILEIIDEYLSDIYKYHFWGYSLPFYLSATCGCHPNYAVYLQEKDSLTVKSFRELLRTISPEDKVNFSKEKAEQYYREYQQNFIDDREVLETLKGRLKERAILLVAPGMSLNTQTTEIDEFIKANNPVILTVNFLSDHFTSDYVFCSNMRRYHHIENSGTAIKILTSNVKVPCEEGFVVNYASYISEETEIVDNSGLMLLKLLLSIGMKEVYIAGMDGYTASVRQNYYDVGLDYDFSDKIEMRNRMISSELRDIDAKMKLHFLTKTIYRL